MENSIVQIMIMYGYCVALWFFGRSWHNGDTRKSTYHINAPDWLKFVCGQPNGVKQLELNGVILQLMMIIEFLLIPVLLWSKFDYQQRGYVFMLILAATVFVIGFVRLVILLLSNVRSG